MNKSISLCNSLLLCVMFVLKQEKVVVKELLSVCCRSSSTTTELSNCSHCSHLQARRGTAGQDSSTMALKCLKGVLLLIPQGLRFSFLLSVYEKVHHFTVLYAVRQQRLLYHPYVFMVFYLFVTLWPFMQNSFTFLSSNRHVLRWYNSCLVNNR